MLCAHAGGLWQQPHAQRHCHTQPHPHAHTHQHAYFTVTPSPTATATATSTATVTQTPSETPNLDATIQAGIAQTLTAQPTATNTPPASVGIAGIPTGSGAAANFNVLASPTGPTATTVQLTPFVLGEGQGGGLEETDVEVAQAATLLPNQQTATAILQQFAITQTVAAGGVVQITATPDGQGGQITQPQQTQPQQPVVQPTPTQQTQDCEYLVQIGDTLSQIARTYNLDVATIANHPNNNIVNPDLIRAGYPITIPGCGQIPPTATPVPATGGRVGLERAAPPITAQGRSSIRLSRAITSTAFRCAMASR
ncbi:MAG: LysM peptidoglycan-binding domain-containing protein [Anaerolineae bacterium]|nr:LysM peptidoglycan-binding domain-containing protein [Anaerolineae bacterium]